MNSKELSKRLTQFEGIYMSGFFINNPTYITALALLFDKVHIPNHLEFVIEFSKRFRFAEPKDIERAELKMNFIRVDTETFEKIGSENPLEGLSPDEIKTAERYLYHSHQFCIHNHELFPEVFTTDLLQNNEVFDVELIEKGVNGALNKYRVKTNPMTVTTDGLDMLSTRIKRGAVPILGMDKIGSGLIKNETSSAKSIATLLAMKSIEMMLPPVKSANPQDILEAREKLSDFLPPFWSAMLKFSVESKNIISNCSSIEEALMECQNIVDLNIRPTLIGLNEKLIKERKNWFYKVISNVGKGVKLVVGKPKLTNFDLLATSVSCSTDIALDYMNHKMKIDALKEEAGLTYLLKLGEQINNSN
jgi:hypothetical protein